MKKLKTKDKIAKEGSKLLSILIFLLFAPKIHAYEREGGISVGGYGSMRFEYLSQGDKTVSTFTLRRIVPTLSATVKERMRFYTEIEFERFGLIELVEEMKPDKGGLKTKTEIEGTDGSEIKLEQMWGEFEISKSLKFRMGAILPPVGRFNILHDDDIWEPARRPLSVRDATVLPSKTAWTEAGAGLNGNFDISESLLGYEFYIVNGVNLEHDFELYVIGGADKKIDENNIIKYNQAKIEAVIKPRSGTFKIDTKKEKAITGRIFISPALGYEVGFSGYLGRYTPAFLIPANLWTLALDFKVEPTSIFDLEGEYALTSFSKTKDVLEDVVKKAFHKEGKAVFYQSSTGVSVDVPAEIVSEIKIKEKTLADIKHGGWLILRVKFFPSFLRGTFLDINGESQLVLFLRPEYVQYRDTISTLSFKNGNIQSEQRENVGQVRNTIGIAYRPIKTFVFSLSYELTNLLNGSQYIHTSGKENQNAILFGFAFGL